MPEYTSCVESNNYEDPPLPKSGTVGGVLSGIFTSLPLLKATCDYMLRGKLVCLGGDQCAIGRVTNFETVADKSFPDTIDNDFSINIVLAPWDLESFTHGSRLDNYNMVANDTSPGSQGYLIKEQLGMPIPRESTEGDLPNKRYGGMFKTFPSRVYIDYNPDPGRSGSPYDVPVLHCEIEGDRAFLVCSTLDKLSSLIPGNGSFCRKNGFFKFLCKVAAWLLTPVIMPYLMEAWDLGSNDNRDFQGASSLTPGDYVVIIGRWVYDAGHSGWNELHPVKSIQKISREMYKSEGYYKLHDKWCDQYKKIPPISGPGFHTKDMTAEQQNVYDNQRRPENRWYLHPLLDGCESVSEPPIR
jgi:hypothetical protein